MRGSKYTPLIIVECGTCGKIELVLPCREKHYKHCSRKCDGKRVSDYMKSDKNPMKNPEVVQKVMLTKIQNCTYELMSIIFSEQRKNNMWNAMGILKEKNPKRYEEMCKETSKRMEENNPVFTSPIARNNIKKAGKKLKEMRDEGIKIGFQDPIVLKKALKASGEATGNHITKGHLKVRKYLTLLNVDFVEQFYINFGDKKRFLDFAIVKDKKAIEYNGFWTHYTPKGIKKDVIRKQKLELNGWKVMYIERDEVFEEDKMLKKLEEFCCHM